MGHKIITCFAVAAVLAACSSPQTRVEPAAAAPESARAETGLAAGGVAPAAPTTATAHTAATTTATAHTAATTTATAHTAATTTAAATTAAATDGVDRDLVKEGYRPETGAGGEQLYCKRVQVQGSRIPVNRCYTAEHIHDVERQTANTLTHMRTETSCSGSFGCK